MSESTDTIFALSSGPLPAGVAVIRLSGPKAIKALSSLVGEANLEPRKAMLRAIRNQNDEVIDQALVIVFPGPNSFTGEDCVEIHSHGSRAVVASIFETLEILDDLRPAEAGEFSRRGLENGKMDLVEVEGLADLLQAETEMQRRLAIEQSTGKLSALYDDWACRITHARALIEAELDFSDEDDIPDSVADQVWMSMQVLHEEIAAHLESGRCSEIIRDGFRVVLVGDPNVGKSTLINALSGRDVAIVTDIAGTTRDILTVDVNIEGYLVRLFDTAGLRDTSDIVEREGVRRALQAAQAADLILLLQQNDFNSKRTYTSFDGIPYIKVRTKIDASPPENSHRFDVAISAQNGDGLGDLRDSIKQAIEQRVDTARTLIPARIRHKKRLEETLNYVGDSLLSETIDLSIRSEYLRLAASSLGRITGRVDIEDLLGIIFSEFCIGK